MPLAQHVSVDLRVGELIVPAALSPIVLDRELSTTQALDVIVRACGQQVLDQVDPLLTSRDASALHDMRVGIRRLRAVLSLLRRPLGDGEKFAWVSTETRDLAAPLGHARDLDVAVRDHGERLTGSPLRKLLDLREGAYDEALAVVSSDRWQDLSTHLDLFLRRIHDEVPVDPPITDAANEALDRRFRQVSARGAELERAKSSQRHKVRIEAKKLRYGAQFFSSLYAVSPGSASASGSPAEDFAHSVGALQDALGDLRDVQVTRHLLELVGATAPDVDTAPFVTRAVAAHADVVARGPFWRSALQ
ncbi:CHAD domain-containing protein [Knoellia sp. S7-12]|uniref:CHAD domain-containing protein n=1 Tax=Knoellia sp. S7-12 TaxID=3126698 RepID=UPI00336954A1